jgi:DNA-binding transcriptional LysR family regulator
MSEPTDRPEFVNLRHLGAWLAVVEEGSVTAAARRLAISQPALSQQLRALERVFGSPLLERLPRGVQPTPLGRALLHDARATLAAAGRLTRQARSVAGFESGVLEIATLPSLVDATLLDPIRRWHREYAHVAIRLREFPLQSLMTESVGMGVGDVAIGVRPPRWSGPVVSLGWEQFVVVLPPGDPLSGGRGPLALSELADRSWVLYEPSNGLADYVTAACAHAGFRPREAVSTSQVQAAIHLAVAGLGPVLVPSDNVPPQLAQAARPLDPPVAWELTAYTRTMLSPPAAAFVELLRDRAWLSQPLNATVLPGS